jgi:DNA-directed RNA polymerase alpha subunit
MRSDEVLVSPKDARQKVREHLQQFLEVVDLHTWSIRSTSRQLFRYLEFFIYVQKQEVTKISNLVEKVLDTLERKISTI